MGFNFETIMQVCSMGFLRYEGISDSMGGRVYSMGSSATVY